MKISVLSFLCAGVLVMPAMACDVCSVYSAAQARGDLGRGFFAGAAEQWTHFSTLQSDGSEIADPGNQRLDSSITQLFGGYNFHERFGLQMNLPLIYRSFRRLDHDGNIDRGSESGIGDMALLLHGNVLNREERHSTFRVGLSGGVKFPTGSASRLRAETGPEDEGEGGAEHDEHEHNALAMFSGIHDHDLALGSGSFDGIVGGNVFARWLRFYFSGALQYAIRTEGESGYRYADDLTWNGGPGVFVLLRDELTLATQVNVSGETKGMDQVRGMREEDTGLTTVYIGPRLEFTWRENLSAELGVELPILLDNTGIQTVPDFRLRAGVTWRF